MSEAHDGAEKFALTVVGLLVAAVVAGVVGLGAARSTRPAASPPAGIVAGSATLEQLVFAPGQDQLPQDSVDALSRIAMAARSRAGAMVIVTVPRDGDDSLADRRAAQVRHALEANGVSPEQVAVGSPEPGTRVIPHRVELRVD